MSRMPQFYCPPLSTPLYWRDEQTGELPAAVSHYYDHCLGHAPDQTAADLGIAPLTAAELKLLCEYCVYFINAPCWEINLLGDADMLADLASLRDRAKTLASLESLRQWNSDCADLGLDPF